MKKYIFLFFAVCAFSVYANAQNRTGDCTSYTSDDPVSYTHLTLPTTERV